MSIRPNRILDELGPIALVLSMFDINMEDHSPVTGELVI